MGTAIILMVFLARMEHREPTEKQVYRVALLGPWTSFFPKLGALLRSYIRVKTVKLAVTAATVERVVMAEKGVVAFSPVETEVTEATVVPAAPVEAEAPAVAEV